MKNPNERIISRGSSDFRRRRDDCASAMGSNDIACTQEITQRERTSREQRVPRAKSSGRRHESASTLHSTTLARAKTNAQGRRTTLREAQSSQTKCFLDDSRAPESTSPPCVGRRTRVSSALGRERFALVRDAVLCNRVTISYSNFQRTPTTREKNTRANVRREV